MLRVLSVVTVGVAIVATSLPAVYADCGRLFFPDKNNNDVTKYKYSTTPWNVGVYRKDASNKYVMICGGTLISSKLVVSAAQFFWERESTNKIIKDENQYYKVGVGKYTRSVSVLDNEFTQIIDVKLIYLEENFEGNLRYYANDISVIVLKNDVIVSDVVMPVCVDWTEKYTITSETIGKIVGWGLTEKKEPSPVVLDLTLPYIDRLKCHKLKTSNSQLQAHVTSDKFCGQNGPGFRGGEAGLGGAGLTFAQSGVHFLAGIMSIKFKETVEILTDVSKHIPWLRNIYSIYNRIDCGRLYTPSTKNSYFHGVKEKFSTAPWNAGVYKRSASNKYDLICGGTLIAPNLIISAAQFFWEIRSSVKVIKETQYYKIAVGKYKRDYSTLDNEFTQILDVELIYLEDNYEGKSQYYANDIVIMALKKNVILSDAVMPICIDWTRKRTIPNGSTGKIVGWGLTDKKEPSPVLLELSLPYTDRITCQNLNVTNTVLQKYVTSDKFCGLKGPEFRGGEAGFGGAGLTFTQGGPHFLVGIMSIKFQGTIEILTDVSKHIRWIRNIYSKYNEISTVIDENNNNSDEKISAGQVQKPASTSNPLIVTTSTSPPVPFEWSAQVKCTIPFTDGSIYSMINPNSNQNTVLRPGTQVPRTSTVEETCEKGYHNVEIRKKHYIKCEESGQWFPPISVNEPLCLKKCPVMTSNSLDLTCTYNGRKVKCSEPSINGTTLLPKCKNSYHLPNNENEYPIELVCLENGKWSGKLYTCKPVCGRTIADYSVLISSGERTNYSIAPWNVALYNQLNNTDQLICGGTIISPTLILSAAHCFWANGKVVSSFSSYTIGVSKTVQNISVIDNEFTKLIKVKDVYIPDQYEGRIGFESYDISIIVVASYININNVVLPACIDWLQQLTVRDGALGMVVGWGETEHKVQSSTLLRANLPYISHDTCQQMSSIEFKNFITKDKFCAGYKSGAGVERGDSGAGYTVRLPDLHFVVGIVSLKENNDLSYATFTAVSEHIDWIREIYLRFQ